MSDRPEHFEEEPKAPRRLVEALGRLSSAKPAVPRAVDNAILEAARGHLKARTQPAPVPRRVIPFPRLVWAAAAAFVMGLGLVFLLNREGKSPSRQAGADVDGNGRVDILDAFSLARRLQAGGTERVFDVNGDGVLDQGDIDWIAARAVKLPKG